MIISHGRLVALDTAENLIGNENTEKTAVLEAIGGEKVLDILKSDERILSPKKSDGENTYTFGFMPNADPRKDLFYKLSSADCPILSLYIKKNSLEEIFLELVEDSEQTAQTGGVK